MKKRFISLLIVILSFLVLVACSKASTSTLNLSSYQAEFIVGDTFSTEGLVVEALLDGSTKNVTSEAIIDSSQVDMNKVGTYAVIVKYDGVEATYLVTVKAKENQEELLSLACDTTNAKLNYLVDETFDSSGLALIATYKNSDGSPDTIKYLTDLSAFTLSISDENNNSVNGAFKEAGKYSVSLSQNNISTSFTVDVSDGASTLASAVEAAIRYKDLVGGGESINSDPNTNNYYGKTTACYEYGDNLNALTYRYNNHDYVENYFINSDNEIVGVRVDEDFSQLNPDDPNYDPFAKPLTILENLDTTYVNGIEYSMFNGSTHYIGPEGLLKGLYDLGKANPNYDYEESITKQSNSLGEVKYIYNFNFGYLEEMNNGLMFYLHKVDVSFSLGEGNFLETLNVKNDVYVVSDLKVQFKIYPKGEINSNAFYAPDRVFPDGSTPDTTDPETGYPVDFPVLLSSYTINDCMARVNAGESPSTNYSNSYSITQYQGPRDAINKYPESEIYVTNYDVLNQAGEVCSDLTFNTMIDSDPSDSAINLTLANFNSETAKNIDTISFVYKGKNIGNFYYPDEQDMILYYNLNTNTILLRFFNYGTYELDMVSLKTTRHITVNVDYRDPTSYTTQVFQNNENPNDAHFIKVIETECFVGDTIYFNVEANKGGDPEFITTSDLETAEIVKDPTTNLPEALLDYDGYFTSFKATVPGTYNLVLKSNRNNTSSTLKVTVKEEPDFTEALSGTYKFDCLSTAGPKVEGSITFTLSESTDVLTGTCTISVGEFSEVLTFTYQNRSFTDCGNLSGDDGRIRLSLNENLEIKITGAYQNDTISYKFDSILVR